MNNDLNEQMLKIRNEIDRIDKNLVDLLNKRFNFCLKLAKLKFKFNCSVIDIKRQCRVFENVKLYSKEEFEQLNVEIFEIIVKLSSQLQQKNIEEQQHL